MFRPLGDLELCLVCAAMLEWTYSATVFLLSDEAWEALRRKIVAEYGEGLELIDPD